MASGERIMKITFNPITLALACRTVASLAFTSVAWGQSFQDPEPGQLKVKGIFIPSQSISGVDQIFHTPRFFHDPDRDGMIELGIGAHRINSSTGSTSDPVYSIGDWRNNWEPNASKFIEWDKLSNDYFYSDQILFRAPNEFYGTYSEGGLLFAASLTGHPC